MKSIILASTLLFVAVSASAYDLKNLSSQDILTIGRALDKLPREETDANGLYQRIQQAVTAQEKAAQDAAAQVVAKKRDEIETNFLAEIEKALLAKIAAEKAAPKSESPGDQK